MNDLNISVQTVNESGYSIHAIFHLCLNVVLSNNDQIIAL